MLFTTIYSYVHLFAGFWLQRSSLRVHFQSILPIISLSSIKIKIFIYGTTPVINCWWFTAGDNWTMWLYGHCTTTTWITSKSALFEVCDWVSYFAAKWLNGYVFLRHCCIVVKKHVWCFYSLMKYAFYVFYYSMFYLKHFVAYAESLYCIMLHINFTYIQINFTLI